MVKNLLACLILVLCKVTIAQETASSCPVNTSGYADLVKKNKPGLEGFLERNECYYDLLIKAKESSEIQLTVDIINLNIGLGTSSFESYSEFLENLVIEQPLKLLDSLLISNQKIILRIFGILNDPLVSNRKDIRISLSKFKSLPKYRVLLSNYFLND